MQQLTQKITPFLWFDGRAEEAARFYTSVFKNSSIENIGDMSVTFRLDGLTFIALNGGPQFTFTPAISFFVNCETQDEVDDFWSKLSAGGETNQCGWLRDKFGVSWQVVPSVLGDLLGDEDEEPAARLRRLAADLAEGAHHAGGLAQGEVVAFGFDVHRAAQERDDRVLAAAFAQRGAQVDQMISEEAQLEMAVGGEPHAVARLAVVVREG
jgi:predicted 3-demethylubiquinone-9 3-methyltransferase (glyoxalase superfamily)